MIYISINNDINLKRIACKIGKKLDIDNKKFFNEIEKYKND